MALTGLQVMQSVRNALRANSGLLPDVELLDLVNQALDWGAIDGLYLPVSVESLAQADDTYEYALSSGDLALVHYIYDIYEETEVASLFYKQPIPQIYWSVEAAATPYLLFERSYWTPSGSVDFRILGGKPQARITDPDDTIYLPGAYVVQKAASLGHMLLSSTGSAQQSRWHESQISICDILTERARASARQFRLPTHYKTVPGRV